MKQKINLGLSRKTVLALIAFARLIKTKMTGNAKFPTPPLALTAFDTLADEAEAANEAYEASKVTTDALLVTRNLKMDALRAGITREAGYVEDQSDTEADVESAGFAVKKAASPMSAPTQVQNLSVTRNDEDGKLDTHWDPQEEATKGYEIEISPDPMSPTSFVHKDIVSESKATLSGLTSGTRVWVRVRGLGNKSQKGPWSNPVSKIVP